jgi:hypothetical protein
MNRTKIVPHVEHAAEDHGRWPGDQVAAPDCEAKIIPCCGANIDFENKSRLINLPVYGGM